jgi:hypothetical protein
VDSTSSVVCWCAGRSVRTRTWRFSTWRWASSPGSTTCCPRRRRATNGAPTQHGQQQPQTHGGAWPRASRSPARAVLVAVGTRLRSVYNSLARGMALLSLRLLPKHVLSPVARDEGAGEAASSRSTADGKRMIGPLSRGRCPSAAGKTVFTLDNL